jgi:L-amino acid N-acyltransferase YncA
MSTVPIRIATPKDAAAIAAIYAPYVRDTPISFELEAPDTAEMAKRISDLLPNYPWLVYELDGSVAGYAYACPHRPRPAYRWCVDVTVYLDSRAHRRGIGRSLYTVLFEILRRQGFYTMYAGITVPNAASVGLHEAMGFKLVAVFSNEGYKLGAWRNVGWWEMALREYDESPKESIPFSQLRETVEIQNLIQRAIL